MQSCGWEWLGRAGGAQLVNWDNGAMGQGRQGKQRREGQGGVVSLG